MNSIGSKNGLAVVVIAGCLPGAVQATDDTELAQACWSSDKAGRTACKYYVAGFLEGALLTDAAVLSNLDRVVPSDSMERAYRTRVGESRASLPANRTGRLLFT